MSSSRILCVYPMHAPRSPETCRLARAREGYRRFMGCQATSLSALALAVHDCRACPLWKPATQAVFGEGPDSARVVLIGEAPGDHEDLAGRPFVGPAGRELALALDSAGLPRRDVWLTNAVKHFKFEERGKRRIHQKPTRSEIKACAQWLDGELSALRPDGVLALGATAAFALFGDAVKVTRDRARRLESNVAEVTMVTVHPSSILRAGSDSARRQARTEFARDLAIFAHELPGRPPGAARVGGVQAG
jgi:uracil-DNA glycosylase family protein